MANLEIDGKTLEVENGKTIIQAADDAGIYIPRFCYHKKLTVAANCRMCLVDVEKMGKPQPACATPVTDGMKVFTRSAKALEAQKAVMEFLLINHPLDCPICDQGGQCELQDLAMGFGASLSVYDESKRAVLDPDLGPLVATDMTRCIQCTRCVRFGQEIAGDRELGAVNRGEHMAITTYIKETVKSELSGNIIDICPVGALTSKPFRFKARAWELQQFPGIAAHDCLGSSIHLGRLRGELLRVNPKEDPSINEVWLSDRDRFSYTGVHSEQRALKPMIKRNDRWETVTWEAAFDVVVNSLRHVMADNQGQVGVIASPSSTCEELYLLQKLARGLGIQNIDHRLHQLDFTQQENQPLCPSLGMKIADIEDRDAILLIGSNIRKEQPIAGLKVRKANLKGAKICAINPINYDFNFVVDSKLIISPNEMVYELAAVLKAVAEMTSKNHSALGLCKPIDVNEQALKIAHTLVESKKASLILGSFALSHPLSTTLQALAQGIAELTGATYGSLTQGANAQGAWMAGVLPHRSAGGQAVDSGLHVQQMWQENLKSYILLNVEPELESANSGQALQALRQAECVIVLSPFVSETMKEYAHVILPIATFAETAGTFINIENKWQSFTGVVAPPAEARPAWKVLRVLGNLFGVDGFDYDSSDQVLVELRQLHDNTRQVKPTANLTVASVDKGADGLQRITETPMYAIDNLVRRAEPLAKMLEKEEPACARVNAQTAANYRIQHGQMVKLTQAGQRVDLQLHIDERVPNGCVFIAAGIKETAGFGDTFGVVEMGLIA